LGRELARQTGPLPLRITLTGDNHPRHHPTRLNRGETRRRSDLARRRLILAVARASGLPGPPPGGRAVFELEVTLPEVLEPELEAWSKAAEANAKRRPGIS
jgi:hypothetical protein